MTTDDRCAVTFPVTDRPVSPPDLDAARAIHDAVAAIERTFVGGADWRSVVGSLHLMRRILEEPPRMCRRCRRPFQLEHGAAFALYRRALASPNIAVPVGPHADRNAQSESDGNTRAQSPLWPDVDSEAAAGVAVVFVVDDVQNAGRVQPRSCGRTASNGLVRIWPEAVRTTTCAGGSLTPGLRSDRSPETG